MPAAPFADDAPHATALARLLMAGPRSAKALTDALGISQPTLSRAIRAAPGRFTTFRISGRRTPQYGLLRALPGGTSSRQTVYRITAKGQIAPFADVEFLSGGATLERNRLGTQATVLYEGLPPYMAFSVPSGFLGRQVAHSVAAEAPFPESLKDWSDDHKVAYLFTWSVNLAGNLVYGDASLEREMQFRQAPATPTTGRLKHYDAMASRLKEASYGSSAGGEQPKFLGLTEDVGHVIVKFAKRGSRMAELLPLEHLALQALATVDVPAAATRLLHSKTYVFLEVQRFDRVGRHGRVGMLSAGAIDDEFFGLRDTWPEFAARSEKARYLSSGDARRIDVMAAFSELIGNGDRHFENISVLIDDDGEYLGLAPAYDILPMQYSPIGGGIDPDFRTVTPKVGTIGAQPAVWARAAKAAGQFWQQVGKSRSSLITEAVREMAGRNLEAARAFVAPLVPSPERDAKPTRSKKVSGV